jgi:hypothetical protein
MNAYGYNTNVRTRRNTSALATAVRFMRAVLEVIGERISAFEIRVAAVLVGFVVTLGIAGGMECGSIPLYIGLPICLVLAAAVLFTHFED